MAVDGWERWVWDRWYIYIHEGHLGGGGLGLRLLFMFGGGLIDGIAFPAWPLHFTSLGGLFWRIWLYTRVFLDAE